MMETESNLSKERMFSVKLCPKYKQSGLVIEVKQKEENSHTTFKIANQNEVQ